ncbi:hypothetical protein IGL98_002958 [Enterococcus sp. DIV0840]|uniref:hypothetical protein n=1 Tax=Enterococcus TaxID=1350 RepID=UPI001A8E341E|nr:MULTISPECIES: hypothetical protein [Enterococcus]MBO0435790.1 hypothetical protein [Enterococcus sp. DIV0849a]MBO0472273.1 hypothetical protein [Enterococcus ureasiticus]
MLSTLFICNAVLASLLITSPIESIASPDDGGVSPVNPLNPEVTVEPTAPPPDQKSENERESNELSGTNQVNSEYSITFSKEEEEEKEENKPTLPETKAKKQSKLHNIKKLSFYPIGNEGVLLEPSPSRGGGSSDFIEPTTQTGQSLARLSGILIYGRKCKD